MKSAIVLVTCLLFYISTYAHAISSSGLLHPLNGIDHLIAMIAVGAYSVQLGGIIGFRNIFCITPSWASHCLWRC
jgi:hydrogenase/urease accessory protein HupE